MTSKYKEPSPVFTHAVFICGSSSISFRKRAFPAHDRVLKWNQSGANGLTSYTVDSGAGTHTKYAYDALGRMTGKTAKSLEFQRFQGFFLSRLHERIRKLAQK